MTRTDAGQTSALSSAAPNFSGVAFVQLNFVQPLYLSTLPYSFVWNGITWIGAGNLGSISSIGENTDLQAQGVSLTLAGIDPGLISIALSEQYQGKQCQIWFCPLDANGQLIGNPIRIFNGRVDTMNIEAGSSATITLSAESALVDFFRVRASRFNDAEQQTRFPGDLGLSYVAQVVEKEIQWGRG